MNLVRLYHGTHRHRARKLSLDELLRDHADPMYQVLRLTDSAVATMSYAAYNGHLKILRAVLAKKPAVPEARWRYEYHRTETTPESRGIIKEYLGGEPDKNCRVS